ncbi:recombination protein NinB [Wohlfahrtiimonas populi]|uniref:recombination protein NinB n=1 Tax=Wohlfahrtiimonas populi TaxID=1940240 RepID=UPI00098D743E|nr:recombination protein NinB [Wohlfahrtiimonas populi]
MTKFYIINNNILQNAITEIRAVMAKGITPLVSISEKKEDRSKAQNRLMHQWFKDIHNMTNHGLEFESGRCKYAYFLPVMASSEDEEVRDQYLLIKEIEKLRDYEYVCKALGASAISSTSMLKVKEFAQALTAMQQGEYQYCLTDPSMMGLDMGRF